jgi:hypothetical protein
MPRRKIDDAVTIRRLRQKVHILQGNVRHVEGKAFRAGYAVGRASVVDVLRGLLGLDRDVDRESE